ncbi:RNA polymerase sigma factor [candidate division KSB1 bacterium]|nr:RNA polymerase sigma factor [candidate division KSB1 bacterium]
MDKESKFKSVVEANQDRIYRICCSYIQDEQERQDVFQKILIHIWANLDSFKGKSQMSTYLYRIAINTCFGALRSKTTKQQLFQSISQPLDEIPDPICPEEAYLLQEDVRNLYSCIRTLDSLDRALIALYLEDVNTKEMAEILGISEVNIRVKLHRIKIRLKKLLENNGYESR